MFNLSKHAQELDGAIQGLGGGVDEAIELVSPGQTSELQTDELVDGLTSEQEIVVRDSAEQQSWDRAMAQISQMSPETQAALERAPEFQQWQQKVENESSSLPGRAKEMGLDGAGLAASQAGDLLTLENSVISRARALERSVQEGLAQQEFVQQQVVAFNLKKHKIAQALPVQDPLQAPMTQPAEPQAMEQAPAKLESRFPILNEGDFLAKFLSDLLGFVNEPGTQQYEVGRLAAEEIRNAVSPGLEEEANSIVETIMQMDASLQQDEAANHLLKLYNILLPPMVKGNEQLTEPVMSDNTVEGIVQFSLTDKVLNNKSEQTTGLIKTAAERGQEYFLYGPTEKRICPKLRGKNLSVGDVVSEYTCRHHCLDGIVIDDNKTICGEALWRANVMDKFSTEYADPDGNIVGGYLNKRFEINHNIPEENRRRLKPGEVRKPKPAACGNMESRLQDMRAKEGQKRGYGPNSNTGTPFNWAKDVNNVNQTQEERNRRAEEAGQQLVQYTNRTEGENGNTKKAFNLKMHKTADVSVPAADAASQAGDITVKVKPRRGRNARDSHQVAVNPMAAGVTAPAVVSPRQTTDGGKPMAKKKSFNMKNYRTSMSSKDIKDVGIKDTYVKALLDRKGKSGKPIGMPTAEKTAETPHPHTVALPDIEHNTQSDPQDVHTPNVNSTSRTKKKT